MRATTAVKADYIVNPEAIVTFAPGCTFVRIPRDHSTFSLDSNALALMMAFNSPNVSDQIRRLSRTFTAKSLRRALRVLLSHRIIVPVGTPSPFENTWRDLGVSTWAYHLDSRNVRFATTPEEQADVIAEVNRTPPPPIYKCLCCSTKRSIRLPTPLRIDGKGFSQIVLNRRTCRNFVRGSLSIDIISTLLFHSAGALCELKTDNFGTVLLKPSPSPGARHSTEVYVFINSPAAINRGVYHYCVKHHRLNWLSTAPSRFLAMALLKQPYFEDASVIFFFTTLLARALWKYKSPRTYRLLHLEVGHYCHNLLLAGTALGLGVFQTYACNDDYVERILRIDGSNEFLMYAAGAGLESPRRKAEEAAEVTAKPYAIPGVLAKPYRRFRKFRHST